MNKQTTPPIFNFDVYSPSEIALRVEDAGCRKAQLTFLPCLVLSILAGSFISLGGLFSLLVMTGNDLGFGPGRLLGGLAFSLGLILVVVAGAELFTGNNLIVMAWADRLITTRQLLRNWGIVFTGNLLGALGTAVLVYGSGIIGWSGLSPDGTSPGLADGALATTIRTVALAKLQLGFIEAFVRGLLCNILVCLAVWMCFAARSLTDKVLAVLFPVTAFVALGFEHSIANLFIIPLGYLAGADTITFSAFSGNLLPVIAGNIIGGSIFVALVYWLVYPRPKVR
ncbi:formate/nitrite transporter family protein [Kiloniella laminariae]|uniref:Formate/nitrite transporter family protein n=1 Tax=Kiloniella laminariae TaxID=454162 RepID=A0ABT4LIX6_9PROT|nr:formate/nitrite transporter family protein [Kiloniella laminariae]MCZ4279942.1 formate/nitrite transporter family protein [Kiloniella laminariae]